MKIMTKLCEVIYGVAMLLIFGTALCADGLADIPHGFLIMFICVGVAGGLVLLGNWLEARIAQVEKNSRPQRWSSDGRQVQRKR